eukprot:snap_masked-scaffold_1-processed-gene-24.28-mRNA-1 protein AED:1.00 eAED:1.00 QI:0/0/0/0/1/1/3/0/88
MSIFFQGIFILFQCHYEYSIRKLTDRNPSYFHKNIHLTLLQDDLNVVLLVSICSVYNQPTYLQEMSIYIYYLFIIVFEFSQYFPIANH